MESLRDRILDALPVLLAACYGVAWAWSSSKPIAGILFLATVSLVASIPKVFINLIFRLMFTIAVAAVVALLPFLIPFLGILTLIGLIIIMRRLLKNWLLISIGFVLYGLLFSVPLRARSHLVSLGVGEYPVLLVLLSFLLGAMVVWIVFFILGKLGYSRLRIARFTFELPGFFIILIVSIVTLAHGDMDGGHDDYAHSDVGHSDEGRG